ncbi:MAG: type II restriction endonuclease [Lactobacillaceae bacterium]|jgi:type II restriction enzyme|nr:type II restriction endonuclease [Lactobacillaceae bacterium]
MKLFNGLTVADYLNSTPDIKLDLFAKTLSSMPKPADYWIDFSNVEKNVKSIGPDIYTLDWLIGKSENDVRILFKERPELLKLVPKLLGIRKDKLKGNILEVDGFEEVYSLNFNSIDFDGISYYLDFIEESGLSNMLTKGLSKSIRDYYVGVEAGMDSNGRKNRSGKQGEEFLERSLNSISKKNNYFWNGQTTSAKVEKEYGLKLEKVFDNRRFDGSIYKPEIRKLYLFEINIFNSGGSKSKSASTEFQTLHERLSRGLNHQFVYITDGDGWKSDQSHLKEAIEYIGYVFNTEMVRKGWLEDFVTNY